MVMRFWGEPAVRAEDFAALVDAKGTGIEANALERAVREHGWRAFRFSGGLAEARVQLQRGRPVVALVRESGGGNHYVVLVGASSNRFALHDPGRGPFRVVDAGQLQRTWRDAGSWGLLILPPERPSGESSLDAYLVPDDELQSAAQRLTTAVEADPVAALPLVELAGVRFRQKRWREAGDLAARAARLQPGDTYTYELLAAARFVQGDAAAALEAWNEIREPRVDLTRIDGLDRTRYDVVTRLLDQPAGTLLTDASLRRSRRRLASLPSQEIAHIDYVPQPGGTAQVNVNVLERPRWNAGNSFLPAAAVHALTERTLRLELAAPTGNGELWSASWRWWKERPAFTARLDVPSTWSTFGIWHVDALWERQSYRLADATPGELDLVTRRRSAIGCGQWATADWHLDVTGALEHWSGRGKDVVAEAGLERRAANERLVLRGSVSRAWNTHGREPYATGNLFASWCSSTSAERRTVRILCRAGEAAASSNAPLLLWPNAGSGPVGTFLLRAHPLLDGGVVTGKGFARQLVHGGLETQVWPWPRRLLSLGFAAFVDGMRPGSPFERASAATQADFGAGLRLQLPGRNELLRLDVARGARDGQMALGIEIGTTR